MTVKPTGEPVVCNDFTRCIQKENPGAGKGATILCAHLLDVEPLKAFPSVCAKIEHALIVAADNPDDESEYIQVALRLSMVQNWHLLTDRLPARRVPDVAGDGQLDMFGGAI